jgi:flagellar biogenesis protein FliO
MMVAHLLSSLLIAKTETSDLVVGSHVWGGGGYAALMFLLLLMLGLLVAIYLFFKRIGLPNIKKAGELELLETRPLGGRQFIVVGKYGEERFLLGVCPGRIDFLCRLSGVPIDPKAQADTFLPKVEND